MILATPLTLLSLGVFLLILPHFFWNTGVIAVGILACLMAFFSIFLDPSLFVLM